ncbi:Ferredoxin reductase-type FAD-binding domain-containing protein [Cynara cardunculus var. scolymus]|uniref:cytochrome-b5 reductase n=1 Tax=Cynara cardunculus var. scolymus TaxID=59895 RepID=A0A103YM75_CYNCS|nr:Ferredoxin reductase-type FAD-binding domain-containing protein [Cynara cardunculus var. scolymus]
MSIFFKRLLSNAAPITFSHAFRRQSQSTSTNFRIPFGVVAAISGGISYFYYFSEPNLVHLDHQICEETGPKAALHPKKWEEFKLQEKATVSHNTHIYRFSFDPNLKLGLDVASAPLGKDAEGKTKYVIRPYTPVSDPDSKGYFDLMIKVYPEGKMSQHFAKLKPGDIVEIAGGSGITPMLQVIETILKNPDDNTKVSLVYANISPDDILLKKRLDMLAASHPNLKVFYTVDNPSKYWVGGTGYISKDMASKGLPAPSNHTLILVCGPPGMMKHISGDKAEDRSQGKLTGILKELEYTEEMVYKF